MFRPLPGPFFGSSPQEGSAESGVAHGLVLCLGVLAVLVALAVWIEAYGFDGQSGLFRVLATIGVAAVLLWRVGLWLSTDVPDEARIAARIYASAMDRAAQPPGFVPETSEQSSGWGFGGVAGLIGDLACRSRRLAAAEQAMRGMRQAVVSSRAQADSLVGELRDESRALTAAALEVGHEQVMIAREMTASAGALALGDMALGRAADACDRLTERVHATTGYVEQATSLAVRLSDLAQATHKAVAEQDERSRHLRLALDQVAQAQQDGERLLTRAARLASSDPALSEELMRLAGELESIRLACEPSLAAAGAVVGELVRETEMANRRTVELGEMLARQHEQGLAAGLAVQHQAAEIGLILNDLYEARSGFAVLRASVEAVTCAGDLRGEAAGRVRETALRLPSQAERMAEILRGLPDFRPPDDL